MTWWKPKETSRKETLRTLAWTYLIIAILFGLQWLRGIAPPYPGCAALGFLAASALSFRRSASSKS